MPRYRALQRVFVDNALREPGDEFVTDAEPHPTAWEPLDKPEPAPAPAEKPEPAPAPAEKPVSAVRAAAGKAKGAASADGEA